MNVVPPEAKWKNWKSESRLEWQSRIQEGQHLPDDKINLGCLQRIAAALETLALPRDRIVSQRNNWQKWCTDDNARHAKTETELRAEIRKLKKTISDLRRRAKKRRKRNA